MKLAELAGTVTLDTKSGLLVTGAVGGFARGGSTADGFDGAIGGAGAKED